MINFVLANYLLQATETKVKLSNFFKTRSELNHFLSWVSKYEIPIFQNKDELCIKAPLASNWKLLTDSNETLYFPVLDSTQSFFKEHHLQLPFTKAVVTDLQLKGKGQREKRFHSEFGKQLLMTVKLEVNHCNIDEKLSFLVGFWLCKLLNRYAISPDFKIKWPNDIYFNQSKIAGILVEKQANSFFVGIGLNMENFQNESFVYEGILKKITLNKIELFIKIQRLLAQLISKYDSCLTVACQEFKLYDYFENDFFEEKFSNQDWLSVGVDANCCWQVKSSSNEKRLISSTHQFQAIHKKEVKKL